MNFPTNCPKCKRKLEWYETGVTSGHSEALYGSKQVCGDCYGKPRAVGDALRLVRQ